MRPTIPASPQCLRASSVCSRSRGRNDTHSRPRMRSRGGRRLHHDRVQREGLLGLGDAVVRHHQAALDPVLVHVLEEVLRAREVVDDRLHGVVDPVEGPGLDLADVAVAVDHVALDAVGQGHAALPRQVVSRARRSSCGRRPPLVGVGELAPRGDRLGVGRLAGLGVELERLEREARHHRLGVHQWWRPRPPGRSRATSRRAGRAATAPARPRSRSSRSPRRRPGRGGSRSRSARRPRAGAARASAPGRRRRAPGRGRPRAGGRRAATPASASSASRTAVR